MKLILAILLATAFLVVGYLKITGALTHHPEPPPHPLVIDERQASDFQASLSKAIADNPSVKPALAKKIKAVLDSPDSLRKRVILRYLERHARAHFMEDHLANGGEDALIDWSKVDWAKVLSVVLQILMLILPLIP